MKTLEDYRGEVSAVLPERAFLRIDRGGALFVTDATARQPGFVFALPGYSSQTDKGLIRITPDYTDVPAGIRPAMTEILKSKTDKPIRNALAVSLRQGKLPEARFLAEMLEDRT